jgi:hypothetical protein
MKAPVRVAARTRSKVASTQPVAKVPKRLHPDELPGAIRSQSVSKPEVKRIERSSGIPATTPSGMAEEAYLDGKWAYERERANLAVRSLQEALELYPGHLAAREMLVKVFEKGGRNGEAMSLLAEGLEIAPDYIVFKKTMPGCFWRKAITMRRPKLCSTVVCLLLRRTPKLMSSWPDFFVSPGPCVSLIVNPVSGDECLSLNKI